MTRVHGYPSSECCLPLGPCHGGPLASLHESQLEGVGGGGYRKPVALSGIRSGHVPDAHTALKRKVSSQKKPLAVWPSWGFSGGQAETAGLENWILGIQEYCG